MNDYVHDDEILFRRVENKKKNFFVTDEGKVIVTYSAFSDSAMQISVDRADLCNNNPRHTQNRLENGVVNLITREVRAIGDVAHGETNNAYEFDVIPDPILGQPQLKDNPAHALIWSDPEKLSDGAYKKLRQALARLATWMIFPEMVGEDEP